MNILVVSPTIPYPMAGFSTRNYHMLKVLASRHAVSLFALDDTITGVQRNTSLLEDMTRELKIFKRPRVLPKRWQQLWYLTRRKPYILNEYHVAEMQKAINEAVLSNKYDAVFFESSLIAGYRLPTKIPVIIDQHNLEYEILLRTSARETARLRKWYSSLEGHLLKPIEIELCRRAKAILVTSEREQTELQHLLPASLIRVVPNGVDIAAFTTHEASAEIAGRIIFTGSLDYYPNINALLFFAQHCWPTILEHIPTATWQIVGKNPPAQIQNLAQLPGVSVTGTVPSTQPYLAQAQVAIVPILIGSGTRLKILEAFAAQKAVVSTSVGCEGLQVEAGTHLLVADQAETFAREVIALLKKPAQRDALAKAGRSLVETAYSWEHCGQQLLQLVEEMEASFHER